MESIDNWCETINRANASADKFVIKVSSPSNFFRFFEHLFEHLFRVFQKKTAGWQ